MLLVTPSSKLSRYCPYAVFRGVDAGMSLLHYGIYCLNLPQAKHMQSLMYKPLGSRSRDQMLDNVAELESELTMWSVSLATDNPIGDTTMFFNDLQERVTLQVNRDLGRQRAWELGLLKKGEVLTPASCVYKTLSELEAEAKQAAEVRRENKRRASLPDPASQPETAEGDVQPSQASSHHSNKSFRMLAGSAHPGMAEALQAERNRAGFSCVTHGRGTERHCTVVQHQGAHRVCCFTGPRHDRERARPPTRRPAPVTRRTP
jgi:hypothetical protein